jgi:hypothetical protein
MITIRYSGREYSARGYGDGNVGVGVNFIAPLHRRRRVTMPCEESARRWLCDNGLRKSKAKKLLAAALRGEGELADPNHPWRVHYDSVVRDPCGLIGARAFATCAPRK